MKSTQEHLPLRFGVMGAAGIAKKHLIPAMLASKHSSCCAVASRQLEKAKGFIAGLSDTQPDSGITPVEGYEALLEMEDLDAIYIALPNDLHVPYALKALEAGKHVLCEKPLALNSSEARKLIQEAEKYPNQKIMEAFMYRFHPQWQKVFEWLNSGILGEVKSVFARFCYFNDDPANIRNSPEAGGGALMDVGCYGISVARCVFDQAPERVIANAQLHPKYGVDDTTHLTLDFGNSRYAQVVASSKLQRSQGVTIEGAAGRIVITHPFYCDPSDQRFIRLETGHEILEFSYPSSINHYQLMLDSFAASVRADSAMDIPLQDSLDNMRVIEAAFASLNSRSDWQDV